MSEPSDQLLLRQCAALISALNIWTHEYVPAGLASICGVTIADGICAQSREALVHDTPRKILARLV